MVLATNLASQDPDVAARAAQALLDRGFGKATEYVEQTLDANITQQSQELTETEKILKDIANRRKGNDQLAEPAPAKADKKAG